MEGRAGCVAWDVGMGGISYHGLSSAFVSMRENMTRPVSGFESLGMQVGETLVHTAEK